jgi:hypothetical protein
LPKTAQVEIREEPFFKGKNAGDNDYPDVSKVKSGFYKLVGCLYKPPVCRTKDLHFCDLDF